MAEPELCVSVVVPAYNEAGRLPKSLPAICEYLSTRPYLAEVIVVDDGSTDTTAAYVRGVSPSYPQLRLLENGSNRGKGYSVKQGILQGRGRYLLFTDADLSTPIEEVDRALGLLQQGWDVVIGSRALDPRLLQRPQPWMRRQAGKAFRWVVRQLTGLPFQDTQCGFKAFRREAAQVLFRRQQIERFGFDFEILWLARRLGFRCLEVGVRWADDRRSHVSLLRDGPVMLGQMLQIAWREYRSQNRDTRYVDCSHPSRI
ncbi:MAG: dolichyl-phosphate beta-glucosyltransferase [Candidatus Acidiferrales bacterium]